MLLVAGGVRGRGEHGDDESGAHPTGLDAKKKTLRASERNEAARAAWREEVATVRPEDLVFLDETGSHLGYTPTHAWAPRGQRAHATAPANRGENKTVVAALTLDGIGPLLRFDGAMTTARFVGYVRHRLAPTLRPGQVVVADNLTAHHSPAVRAAIEAARRPLPAAPGLLARLQSDRGGLLQGQARPSDAPRLAPTTTSAPPPGPPSPPSPRPTPPAGSPTAATRRAIKPHEERCSFLKRGELDIERVVMVSCVSGSLRP